MAPGKLPYPAARPDQPEREGRRRGGRRRAQRPAVPRGSPVMAAAPAPGGPSLLIIGHGTRDATGVEQFRQLIGRVRDQAAGWLPAVDGGFIELSAPPVGEVVSRLLGARLGDRERT